MWFNYKKYVHDDGIYYCHKCALRLLGKPKEWQTKFNMRESFGEWCNKTGNYDILNRWAYDLNKCSPYDILSGTNKRYYFNCPRKIHKPELFKISIITSKQNKLKCKRCNSFAQFLLDEFGLNGIKLYWSIENGSSPWNFTRYSNRKVLIKCNELDCGNVYSMTCGNFVTGARCPVCNSSKGEKKIKYFLDNSNISFVPQQTFDNLLGVNNGLLSYDFYLPDYNLLIEYQGQFHDGTSYKQTQEEFEIQQIHDQRKCQYAKEHNIELLEIWYWDFDNIEQILKEKLLGEIK
jgi:hypothetical protein